MNILITGGAGFIGSYLANDLIFSHDVTVIDNLSRGLSSRLNPKIRIIQVDLTAMNQVEKLGKDYDWIIHLAAINGTDNFYKQNELVFTVGVKSILNLYDHFKYTKASIIIASSAEVYQTPLVIPTNEDEPLKIPDIKNPRYSYGGSKIFSELVAFNYGLDFFEKVIVFRPHNIYGPNMGYKHVIPQLIQKIKIMSKLGQSRLELIGAGLETRAFCHVNDAVNGLKILMNKGVHGEIYHIGNDTEEVQIRELANRLVVLSGISNVAIIEGVQSHHGGTNRRCPSVEKIRSLGYKPGVTLDKGLEETFKWYNEQIEIADSSLL